MADISVNSLMPIFHKFPSPRKIKGKKYDPPKESKIKRQEKSVLKRKINRDKYWKIPSTKKDICTPVSLYAEMSSLSEFYSLVDMPPVLKRYYRKMFVSANLIKEERTKVNEISQASVGIVNKISLNPINCSYTNRVLKPFIFQDFEVNSPWLELHSELRKAFLKYFPSRKIKTYKKHPLNYMYITADHIPAINSLAETYFWPGIDVSISLSYPEFSCVALYKKIIVGFGMMAPGTHLNEAYISFFFVRPHWRKHGIGMFILYHLINTALSWDITLHAALSNDAILLYNKFTFKVHKMLRNFYDGRLPIHTAQSGHAFFMQLEKSVVI